MIANASSVGLHSILAGIRGIPAILRPAALGALDRCHDPPSRFHPLLAAVTQRPAAVCAAGRCDGLRGWLSSVWTLRHAGHIGRPPTARFRRL